MSDIKMNMSLDEIIKNNKDKTNVNKSKGFINKPGFNRKNYTNKYFKDSDDNQEKRFVKNNNMSNRQNNYNRDHNNRTFRTGFHSYYRNRFENVQRNKVQF